MNDFVTSLIRTYVPIGVGALVSYLVTAATGFDGLFNQPPNILWWKNDSLYTTIGQV